MNQIEKCVDEWAKEMGVFEKPELVNVPDILDLREKLNAIAIPKDVLKEKIWAWAIKYGYKGISKECEDELFEILKQGGEDEN